MLVRLRRGIPDEASHVCTTGSVPDDASKAPSRLQASRLTSPLAARQVRTDCPRSTSQIRIVASFPAVASRRRRMPGNTPDGSLMARNGLDGPSSIHLKHENIVAPCARQSRIHRTPGHGCARFGEWLVPGLKVAAQFRSTRPESGHRDPWTRGPSRRDSTKRTSRAPGRRVRRPRHRSRPDSRA